MFDLLVKNGTLIDPAKSAPQCGDLLIDQGRIVSRGCSRGRGDGPRR